MIPLARVTAILEAKDRITPELVKIRRDVNQTERSFGGIERGFNRSARGFQRDSNRIQREIQEIRQDLNRLGSMKEKPRVELDDRASQDIADLREKLMGLGGLAVGLSIGTNVGGAMSEIEAAFKERALYAAKGKTQQELEMFDQKAKEMLLKNPFLNRAEAMALVSKSEKLNGANASGKYAETAAKLGVTTAFSPEEHLKVMAVMGNETGVKDAERLGNSIQYMSNNMKDFRDEFVDSMIEYSVQMGKFLDTPEKIAALVGEIGRMGIWSDDKALDALKESTLKLTNQGDLANVLKTGYETQGMEADEARKLAEKEAALINELIHSGNEDDSRTAMGRMMMSLATIQDKNVQRQVLNELGAGPGEDLGRHFAPLLEYAGKLSIGEIRPQIGNELEKAYKAAVDSNPLFEYQKAQNEAKQAALDLGAKIAQDVTPALAGLSEAAKWVTDKFNAMPDMARYGLEFVGAGVAISAGAYMLIRAASMQLLAAKALARAGVSGGVGGMDIDVDGGKKVSGKGRRRWWNPRSWGGNGRDKSSPEYWLEKEEQRLEKQAGRKERWSWLDKINPFGNKQSSPVDLPTKGPDYSNIGLGKGTAWKQDPAYRDYKFEKTLGDISKANKLIPEVSKAGGVIRKVPYLGTALGVAEVATADNKLDAAGRLGAEALGGWGGAAAGAAAGALVGSVIPLLGTAIGGAIGGIIGGIGGSYGGGALYDGAKEMLNEKGPRPMMKPIPKEELQRLRPKPVVFGPPAPNTPPGKTATEKPKAASVNIQSLNIPVHAAGILQDIPTMLKMMQDPQVSAQFKKMMEKFIIDALETSGGVT
ncbi:hypothetical protein X546_04435 [Brevibacillus borstelensis cifa_chp40]|nr:hypothetical protein X546_04435 [Brevibacillus borstelensis cifa_chp40]